MVGDSKVVMQAKGFDSQLVVDAKDVTTPIDNHHVEVSATGDVPLHHVMPLLGLLTYLGMLKHYSQIMIHWSCKITFYLLMV